MTTQEDTNKKVSLEELDKEELIKKCKGLLSIAQKAKQAKAELVTDIESYKLQLERCISEKNTYKENVQTLQELVNSLTEQKLTYITDLHAAENKAKAACAKCKSLQEEIDKYKNEILVKDNKHADVLVKLSNIDTEMISLKRQNNRLTEENEQLISQLSELESQIVEFNKIGLEQQKQLQKIEEQVGSGDNSGTERFDELNTKVGELERALQTKEAEKDNYETKINEAYEKIKEITNSYNLEKDAKEKANIKLKSYKDKILKCAQCINELKNSKYILSKTVKDYSQSIPKWQAEIIQASKYVDQQLSEIFKENASLKCKLKELESKITDYTLVQSDDKILDMQNQIDNLTNTNEQLNNALASVKAKTSDMEDSQSKVLIENEKLSKQIQEVNEQLISSNKHNETINKKLLISHAENVDIQKHSENLTKEVSNLILQIKALEIEKSTLVQEKLNAKESLQQIENANNELSEQVSKLRTDLQTTQQNYNTLQQEKEVLQNKIETKKQTEANNLHSEITNLKEQLDLLKKEYDNVLDLNSLLKEEVETLKLSLEQPKDDSDNLSDLNDSMQADIVKLETKLAAYKQENASLLSEIKESRAKTQEAEAVLTELEEAKSKLTTYKTENAELLNEMKEINQVLKERGETISKLQKAISEMEGLIETLERDRDDLNREKDELVNKLAKAEEKTRDNIENVQQVINERDITLKKAEESEAIILTLREEIERLKQQASSGDLPNEDMSTSTISKAEEHSRMRDLDESFEDKYSKLRIFALKLKKKLNETTTQLQNAEQDKAKLKKIIADKTSTKVCQQDRDEVDGHVTQSNKEKIDELQGQIHKLNVALEASEEARTDIDKLKAELAGLSEKLIAEVEAHKITKENLDKARRDAKKKSVLSLEMEDYERSMKELTTKMEENKKKIVQMESTIDTQEGTIKTMKTQIKLLEEQIKVEENQNRLLKEELHNEIQSAKEKDNTIQQKNELISILERDIEDEKRKNEDASFETTALLTEKEKVIMSLGEEKAELNSKLKKAEFLCADLKEKVKVTNIELEDLKSEYSSYKVRAQAVLRQNQTVDHSQEEHMKEEVAALKAQIDELTVKLNAAQDQCSELRSSVESERRRASESAGEANRAAQRLARLQADLSKMAAQADNERSQYKVQISTLTQCYKSQISELEGRLHKETEDLKQQLCAAQAQLSARSELDKLNKNQQYLVPVIPKDDSDGELDINVSMLPREEGEGSEWAPSPPLSKSFLSGGGGGGRRSPVPLDRLLELGVPEDETVDSVALALSPEQELEEVKSKLQAQQQRVKHVTVLLSESERECARYAQMNEVLKSEVRRARGSLERTQHAHNAEYMKNVTMKFLTLPPGDERLRLVPVLQKILTLTPEETSNLNAVAKGVDPTGSKGWGSYLPWPGGK